MRPPQWEKLYRHLSREYSEKRERERETLWMIMIITKVETVTGTDNVGLLIEKERRGTCQGHALARADALNVMNMRESGNVLSRKEEKA
ncbi:unnamed protein product [Brassica oleracea var. botrytis]